MQALRLLLLSMALMASNPAAWAWEPPAQVDPDVIANEAFSDAVDGKLADAAQKHLWYHQNSVRLKPMTAQVRLTFVLEEWVKLARRYPPAMQDLLRTRDLAADRVLSMQGDLVDAFTEVVRINELIGDADSTCRVYAALGRRDETLAAKFWLFAVPAMAQKQDHALALRYLQVDKVLETLQGQLSSLRQATGLDPDTKAMLQGQANRHIDLTVARIVWVLLQSSLPERANDVATRGKALLGSNIPTPQTDAALRGAPLRREAS